MRRAKIVTPISDAWAGRSLVDVVGAAASLEPAAARDLIERGGAWLERRRVQDTAQPVVAGHLLSLHFPPPDERPVTVTAAGIVYEDSTLLVLNKPPGAYVTMTPWDATNNLLCATRRFLVARDGAAPDLHAIHQLDRDTSGLLVFSKEPRANAPLQAAFLDRAIHKRYLTMVAGSPAWEHLEVRTGHGRGEHGLFRVYPLEAVGDRVGDGRRAVKLMETRFETVERFGQVTLLAARPLTGRTHQIRLHLRHTGYPVAGDRRYGGAPELAGMALPHHLLHAAALDLPHPLEDRWLRLTAPLPSFFAEVLAMLRAGGRRRRG